MRQRSAERQGLRASGFTAAVAMLAFMLVLLFETFHIAHSVNDALLNTDEIFRRAIPLATLIAAVLFAVLVGGLIWFHINELESCWKKISGHLKNRLPVWRYVVGTSVVVGLFILALALLPEGGDAKKPQIALREPVEQPKKPKQPLPTVDPPNESSPPEPSVAEPTLPKSMLVLPMPRPRMADRDVCDLFDDPTDAELNACTANVLKHPNRRGTGGPICVMIRAGKRWRTQCLPWPPPLPRARPPFNILPNLN